ncbi:MAG TPA: autotransporter outer membrane beta-barrel domain-containing protein [Allosphingosinicella sp.]|nr:autotransporter outer membrane beta-barrel domain-containing protein [Allosphingosinicella sp.]
MRRLLAYSCLTPLALVAVSQAQAERKVETKITAPLSTSTATNGAADNITITTAGGITLTGGTAVTLDSSNTVTSAGALAIQGANNATGILAMSGLTGGITNSGTITIDENYTPADADKDGDLDGPFAQGSNRFGIRIAPGGTFTGNVVNSGTITIEGNTSAGIALDSRLNGTFTNSGTINVTGDNSVGIRATDIAGNTRIAGGVNVRGANAVGVSLDGDIAGALTFQGTVTASGYRSIQAPADATKLDADDLLQGGPAIRIQGDVSGGIRFAVPPADANKNDDDEDDDGIKDSEEGAAQIVSYGAAPAVQIGAANGPVSVGAVAGNANGHGLIIDGAIGGNGVYANVDGNGLVIGGLGGNVTIAGGMTVTGAVTASSNGGSAQAIRIGSGASVPEIRSSGAIRAAGGPDAADVVRGIQIDQGASVVAVRNTGLIEATGGKDADVGAIVDRTGGVGLVENGGRVIANLATGGNGKRVAIDLSGNNAGATVRQYRVSDTAQTPQIQGDILFGGGNDLLDVTAGSVAGTARFGNGDDRLLLSGAGSFAGRAEFGAGADRLALTGTSVFTGIADFGGGADLLEIGNGTRFDAQLLNSAGLAVNVAGGTFQAAQTGNVQLASLTLGANSRLGIDINTETGVRTNYVVAGNAAFGTGTKLAVRLNSITASPGRYSFLQAGSVTGGANLAFDDASLPILFRGTVESGANEVALVISRRTAADLGLNGSATRAYDAIFESLDNDEEIASVFLGMHDREAAQEAMAQMLPNHAGGVFETVTVASRATARFLADPNPAVLDMQGWGFWLQQAAWGTSKETGSTAAFDVSGWGAAGGAELQLGGAGNLGLSLAYLAGKDANGDNDNQVRSDQYELAAYWRLRRGGFNAFARASAAMIDFTGLRYFAGLDQQGQAVTRTAAGNWNGQLYSASAGLSYELRMGRLSLRPAASIDYYKLSEDGYTETGGGDGFNLVVEDRDSDELAGTVTLAAGLNFGSAEEGRTWIRTEIEGGRRQILGGSLGATVARFEGGDPFTLEPEARTDGWTGALRVIGGSDGTVLGAELSAEEQSGRASVAFRVSFGFGF